MNKYVKTFVKSFAKNSACVVVGATIIITTTGKLTPYIFRKRDVLPDGPESQDSTLPVGGHK